MFFVPAIVLLPESKLTEVVEDCVVPSLKHLTDSVGGDACHARKFVSVVIRQGHGNPPDGSKRFSLLLHQQVIDSDCEVRAHNLLDLHHRISQDQCPAICIDQADSATTLNDILDSDLNVHDARCILRRPRFRDQELKLLTGYHIRPQGRLGAPTFGKTWCIIHSLATLM